MGLAVTGERLGTEQGDEGSRDRGLGQRPPLWLEANQSKLAKLQSRCSPIRIMLLALVSNLCPVQASCCHAPDKPAVQA